MNLRASSAKWRMELMRLVAAEPVTAVPHGPEANMNRDSTITGADLMFALLLALISTGLSYQYAVGNQLEQLPIILQQLDKSYLPHDFFLMTAREFGPRIYFVKFVSALSELLPLPWSYAVLTALSDLALVIVTLWVSRSFLGASRLAAAVASVWTLGLGSFYLGDATQIRYEVFQPASLAIPGALWALGLGLRGRPIAAALVAGIASLPHPLYGAMSGAIALATAFIGILLTSGDATASSVRSVLADTAAWRRAFLRTIPGAVVLALILGVFWLLPYAAVVKTAALSSTEFVDILIRFRSPHHYLPSAFRGVDYVSTAFFLAAMLLAYLSWAHSVAWRTRVILLVPVVSVLAGCVIGTIFSEWLPLRAVLTLQLFRFLCIVKWLGFMLIANLLISHWQKPAHAMVRPLVVLSLVSGGASSPLVSVAVLVLLRLCSVRIAPMLQFTAMAAMSVFLWWYVRSGDDFVYLVLALTMLALWELRRTQGPVLAALFTGALMFFLTQNRGADPLLRFSPLVPIFDATDQQDTRATTARAVAAHTKPSDLLIAPPEFGLLRVIGKRALVVDFKSVPLQDAAMREWYRRMHEVYGETATGGHAAARDMDAAYHAMTDQHLEHLAQEFGATHALLYADAATTLPVVFSNETYRLVRLSPKHKEIH